VPEVKNKAQGTRRKAQGVEHGEKSELLAEVNPLDSGSIFAPIWG